MYLKCQVFTLSTYLWCSIDLTPKHNTNLNKWISKYLCNVQKHNAEMVIVNRTWLKLAARTQRPATVKWAASIVLNKLQKSGKAKYHTVTF